MRGTSPLFVCIVPEGDMIDYTLLRDHVTYPECGAVVTFEGVVRLTEEGQPLEALNYDHHEAMALLELEKVCRDALGQFDVTRIACAHRIGRVAVQEASVVIVVGADHRVAAFEACQYVIDTLKRSVPIWKAAQYNSPDQEPSSLAKS